MELYVHIPFCRRKCAYCDFPSWAGREEKMAACVGALLAEASAESEALGAPEVETVFLGGGTPSLLPPPLLRRLLTGLRERFPIRPGAECTTEANPGTLTAAWLETALEGGINRLSLGMQAAQPALLGTLGRIHGPEETEKAVGLARAAGIRNLNLDLMFGIPGQTRAMWRESLEAALALSPEHMSCYGLIPEPGTPLKALLDRGALRLPGEEEERAMYDDCLTVLGAAGYGQYEISNFARPGFACRHNLGYWRMTPYLGLGVAAASMLPVWGEETAWVRRTNPPDLDAYLRMAAQGSWSAREEEAISRREAMFETMMLGLRTTAGVAEEDFARLHGKSLPAIYGDRLTSLEARGLVAHGGGRWRLTRRGMDIQNSVLVELMDD